MKILIIRSAAMPVYEKVYREITPAYENAQVYTLTTRASVPQVEKVGRVHAITYTAATLSLWSVGILNLWKLWTNRFDVVYVLYQGNFIRDYKKIKLFSLFLCAKKVKAVNAENVYIPLHFHKYVTDFFLWWVYGCIWFLLWVGAIGKKKRQK